MKAAAICLLVGAFVGACSASVSATSTSVAAVTSSTLPASTTTTTLVSIAEPTWPLFDGEMEAAWNRGDLEAFDSYFADKASFDGRIIGSEANDAVFEYLVAAGFRSISSDCTVHDPTYATCSTLFVDDFHGPAGLSARGETQVWFDEVGLIKSYGSGLVLSRWDEYEEAFGVWVGASHPDIAASGWILSSPDFSPEGIVRAIGVVDEFLESSDEYPIGEVPQIPDPILTGASRGIDVYNADTRQLALVEWALSRIEGAGLPLPPVTHVTFPPTTACDGRVSGMAYHNGVEGHIDVCSTEEAFSAAELPLSARRNILHEFAHLWSIGHLDEATMASFLELRGLSDWSGHGWEESGSEHAAEILMWGWLDQAVVLRVPETSCDQLAAAYELLTGLSADDRLDDCG